MGTIGSQLEKMWIWLPQVLHVDVDLPLPKIVQQEYTFGISLCGTPIGWLSNGKDIPLSCLGGIGSQFEKIWIWLPKVLYVVVDVGLPLPKIVQQEYTFGISLCGSPIGWLSNGKDIPLLFLGAKCSQFEKMWIWLPK
ncbi:MAG: hypothetical protein GY679_04630, partial [Mycoplasma sp.]|nr:hypothetical protein [Mycoplasma sp.]